MLVPVHRAVSAVLHVMLVAFVTLSARVQHGVLRSKHWFAPARVDVVMAHHLPGCVPGGAPGSFLVRWG